MANGNGTPAGIDMEAAARYRVQARLAARQRPVTELRDLTAEAPYNRIAALNSWTLANVRQEKALGPVEAVPTPLPSLNRMCLMAGGRRGMAHGWYAVSGAASSKGKTTSAVNFAVHAMRHGEVVLYFALEEDMEDIATRAVAIASGYDI